MRRAFFRFALCFLLFAGLSSIAPAQTDGLKRGTARRIKVHGKSLERNLEGDSPDRDVSIFLPPGYDANLNRRYPVIYLLHGYTDTDARWFGLEKHFINVPEVVDKALASGTIREMIVVMPNAYTAYAGSMYSNSVTTGDWEEYIAHDLVNFVDEHYRTIADVASRGLAGHSMGGYGAIRIGMKHPEVFSSVYAMSPCCLTRDPAQISLKDMTGAEAIHSAADFAKAPFFVKATMAAAAAWSPDPKNPPFYLDLPTKAGAVQPGVLAQWSANEPAVTASQYVSNLTRLHALALDVGEQDDAVTPASLKEFDRTLSLFNIPHTFEIYQGNHVSRVSERVETRALPFFSKNLSFTTPRR